MLGFVIHIAIAKQYIKKNKNEIKDEKVNINNDYWKGCFFTFINRPLFL